MRNLIVLSACVLTLAEAMAAQEAPARKPVEELPSKTESIKPQLASTPSKDAYKAAARRAAPLDTQYMQEADVLSAKIAVRLNALRERNAAKPVLRHKKTIVAAKASAEPETAGVGGHQPNSHAAPHWSYEGEGVLWMVMKQPVQLSADQIAIFSRLYPMNARPIQAGSGRLIKESN